MKISAGSNSLIFQVLLHLSALSSVKAQDPVYLFGNRLELECAVAVPENSPYLWGEVQEGAAALNIYFVDDVDDRDKSNAVDGMEKYDNFGIDNNYPHSVNLTIQPLEIEDRGSYSCSFIHTGESFVHPVIIEALPDAPVSMVCDASDMAVCPSSDTSSDITCTCTANGAYPSDLQFEWSHTPVTNTTTNRDTMNTQRPGTYDFSGVATFRTIMGQDTVTCTLEGYQDMNHPEANRAASYRFVPPTCTITIVPKNNCQSVDLRCICEDSAQPAVTKYQFYDESGSPISEGQETGQILDYTIFPDVGNYTFGCTGCNGVTDGSNGYHIATESCIPTMVTTPSISTKEDGTPTGTKGPPVGLIIGLSVGIPIFIIMLVLVIWFLKNRDGDSDKNKPDPPQNDDAVITMNASTTSSLAPLYGEVKKDKKKKSSPNDDTSNTMPLYGEVKKDRKKKSDDSVNDFGNKETPAVYAVPDKNKKSDKPDGNGAGPESDMPTYADVKKPPQPTAAPRTSQNVPDDQPMQEIQYADLDHGKQPPTNEIRKPQDEPTEYATVQSVIV